MNDSLRQLICSEFNVISSLNGVMQKSTKEDPCIAEVGANRVMGGGMLVCGVEGGREV